MLTEDARTRLVPIIIYSALGTLNIEEEFVASPMRVASVAKGPDERTLVALIRSMLEADVPLTLASSNVFIVHGHDHDARETVARLVEKIGQI